MISGCLRVILHQRKGGKMFEGKPIQIVPLYKLKRGEQFKTRGGHIAMVVTQKKQRITYFYAASDYMKKNRMHLDNLVMVVPTDQKKNWDAMPSEYPVHYKRCVKKDRPKDSNQTQMF